MQKTTKKLLGLVGLALVVLLTIFAYFLPSNGVYADSVAGTDTIRITVISEYPSIKIDDPDTDYLTTSPILGLTFTYENASYVDFTATYTDGNGNTTVVALPRFNPSSEEIDPELGYGSGTSSATINLRDSGLDYGHYIIEAVSGSTVGESAGDSIEFDYAPATLEEVATDENTNDPIVEVTHDSNIARIEIMPIDENGNPLLDEPVIIEITPDENGNYPSGVETVTLPFTSNGLEGGVYDILVNSYSPSNELLYSPKDIYPASYEQPIAPEAPNTGSFFGKLNIAESDYVITIAIVFAAAAAIAFRMITRKKKDYRKNIRSRK
ncbi:hypothetical protein IK146_01835 [Candidatus Saccharibacteria bacterium]|nr:hypothetical protein [Candidatus Saccharibacteria bacterium]